MEHLLLARHPLGLLTALAHLTPIQRSGTVLISTSQWEMAKVWVAGMWLSVVCLVCGFEPGCFQSPGAPTTILYHATLWLNSKQPKKKKKSWEVTLKHPPLSNFPGEFLLESETDECFI